MGGVPGWAHRPYHVGVSGGGKWEVGSEWIFFTAKHFVIKKNLLTLHLEKKCCTTSLYNIKTMGYIIACDNTNDKNT